MSSQRMGKRAAIFILVLATWAVAPLTGAVKAGELAQGRQAGAVREKDADTERRMAREGRFVLDAIGDFRSSAALAEDEIKDVENQIDAIAPLESPKREAQFRQIIDWYRDYADWLNLVADQVEDDQARGVGWKGKSGWSGLYDDAVKKTKQFQVELARNGKKYDGELQRLIRSVERKQFLLDRQRDLEDRLARIEERLADRDRPAAKRGDDEKKAAKVRVDVQTTQRELLALADLDENLLKHYMVLIERAEAEGEWLSLKIDQYDALRDAAGAVVMNDRRDASEIQARYRTLIRMCENWIDRLTRMKDGLDRKRLRISSVGSLKELDRSRDLADFYQRLGGRYDGEIGRLRSLIGEYDAELSAVQPARGK